MIELPFTPVSFDPEAHKYTDSLGREYISVTTLLSEGDPFDSEGIAASVIKNPRSKYYGMTKEAVLLKWKQSAPMGTAVHEAVEDYINTGNIQLEHEYLVKQFSRLNFTGELLAETRLHHEKYLIAGTADIIEHCGDCIWLWDIKTSVSRPDGKDMDRSKKHKYALQLGIYKVLIEHLFKVPCHIGGILWFKDYTKNLERTRLRVFEVDDVQDEVEQILRNRLYKVLNV